MAIRQAEAEWRGDLRHGQGTVRTGSGTLQSTYSYPSRFEEGRGTSPEELIGAAHAGCFSMALAAGLSAAGHVPRRVSTNAKVHLEQTGDGFAITRIELWTEVDVSGLDSAAVQQHAETAKRNCPVSKALAGTSVDLHATLAGTQARASGF